MSISLEGGDAMIELKGKTSMPCWCGSSHVYSVEAVIRADSSIERLDMDDLDAAIRGELQPARRIGWRLMHKLFFNEIPPCERVAVGL